MGKCIDCGKTFDGWSFSCPECVAIEKRMKQQTEVLKQHTEAFKEQTEAIERSQEETRELYRREREADRRADEERVSEMEEAAAETVAEAAEAYRRTQAESWKIQAQSKSDRAYDLYRAGMHDEAIDMARRAIKQDPSNIEPYMFAAWSLEAAGSVAEATWYFRKQIDLLRIVDNRESASTALRVLRGLPADEDLRKAFCIVLHENSHRWSISSDTVKLLSALTKRGLVPDARLFLESLVSRLDNPLSADTITLVNTLIKGGLAADVRFLLESMGSRIDRLGGKDLPADYELMFLLDKLFDGDVFLQEAQPLVKSLAARTRRLLPHVCLLEIIARLGEARADTLTDFLKEIPFRDRNRILYDAKAVVAGKHNFSPPTIVQVKEAIAARYEQWRPEIDKVFAEEASKVASRDAASESRPITAGWIIAIAGILLFWSLARFLDQFFTREELNQFASLLLLVIFAVPAITGVVTSRLLNLRTQRKFYLERLRIRWTAEDEEWSALTGAVGGVAGSSRSRTSPVGFAPEADATHRRK